jgi:hypothetical protein
VRAAAPSRHIPGTKPSRLIELEHPHVQHQSLLKRGAQRAVEAVLQVQIAAPADHVREQVAVERRVGGEHGVQVKHVLSGDQLIKPDWPRRYLSPLAAGPAVIGVWPPVPDLLEDHKPSLDDPGRAAPRPARGPVLHGAPGLRLPGVQGDPAGSTTGVPIPGAPVRPGAVPKDRDPGQGQRATSKPPPARLGSWAPLRSR